MKNSCRIMLLALLALSATACIKEGYDTEGCPGEFTIIPVYPDSGTSGPEELETIVTLPDGTKKPVIIGKDNPLDLGEGKYTITATQGNKENVTVDGNKVTIDTNPDGTAKEPGEFSGGYVDIVVGPDADDKDNSHTLTVTPQSRPLNIVVKFAGNNAPLVKGVAGEISGIAFSRDLAYGFAPLDGQPRHPALQTGNVAYGFDPATGQVFLSETHRLLGIDGDAEQHLTLDILLDQDVYKQYDFDVTEAMNGFHITEVDKVWTIEITINLGADFSATIEDWKAGPDIWMDAVH